LLQPTTHNYIKENRGLDRFASDHVREALCQAQSPTEMNTAPTAYAPIWRDPPIADPTKMKAPMAMSTNATPHHFMASIWVGFFFLVTHGIAM
jgi:hypothetical protein